MATFKKKLILLGQHLKKKLILGRQYFQNPSDRADFAKN